MTIASPPSVGLEPVPLGELASFVRGVTFDPSQRTSLPADGRIACFRTSNIQDELAVDDVIFVPPEVVGRDEQMVREGDILISSANSWELVGKAVWIPKLEYPATVGGFTSLLRADRKRVDPRYLYFWFRSPLTQQKVRECSRKTTNISNLSFPLCAKLLIPIPFPDDPRRSVAEQKRIAAMLDKADAIRRRRQEAARLADTLMMSGFHHIVGPLAQGYRSWKRGTIESLASPEPGSMRTGPFGSDLRHSEFVSEGVAVLGIDNAVQNRFAWDERRFITHDKYEYLQRYTVRPNDVIVTIMGTTGRSAVVPDDIPLAITTKHLATITVNRKVAEPEFVSHSIYRHPEVLTQIANSHRGAIMPGLNLGLIRRLEIPVPPLPVQHEFARFVKSVRDLESLHRTKQLAGDELFNALIQRAFRGEL